MFTPEFYVSAHLGFYEENYGLEGKKKSEVSLQPHGKDLISNLSKEVPVTSPLFLNA